MDVDPYADFLERDLDRDEAEEAEGAQRLTFLGGLIFLVVIVLLLALVVGPIMLTAQILQWFATGIWAPYGVAQFLDWMGWPEPSFAYPLLQQSWIMLRHTDLGAVLFVSSMLMLLVLSRLLRR